MRSNPRLNALFWMQLAIGVFFVTLGIIGLSSYNAPANQFNRFFTGGSDFMDIVIAILELAAGGVLVVALFAPLSSKTLYFACIVVLILWAFWVIYVHIVNGFAEPNFMVWLNRLSLDVIPGIGVWMIAGRYR